MNEVYRMSLLYETVEDYKESFENFLRANQDDPDVIRNYFCTKGHFAQMHTAQADDDMRLRAIKEHTDVSQMLDYVPADGEFSGIDDIIAQSLMFHSQEIAEFVTSPGNGKLELDTPFDNVVGYGIQDKSFEMMDSSVVRMVIKKDPADPYLGMKVETAFPKLRDRNANYIRQYECSHMDISPYKDGKLTVSPDKLDDLRRPVMTKKEAAQQIAEEIIATLKAERDRRKDLMNKLVKDFSKEEHIPSDMLSIEKQKNPRTGKTEYFLAADIGKNGEMELKTVGFFRKDFIAVKYKSLDEVKAFVRQTQARSRAKAKAKDDIGLDR